MSRSGLCVPRPLGSALHSSLPSEVWHIDYFFLRSDNDETKYVLVVQDAYIGFAWLSASSSATADHAAQILAYWQRTRTASKYWVSDQSLHSINKLLRDIVSLQNIHLSPAVAHCTWVNHTVESLNHDILTALKSSLIELKPAAEDCVCIIDAVSTISNEFPTKNLGRDDDGARRALLKAMTGIRARHAIAVIMGNEMRQPYRFK